MNGIINVIKPPNMTSQDVVSYLRGLLEERRIGHGGTLDPGAAGVLPVFLGRATRLCDYSIQGDKEYLGEISFGVSTDTQDSYGNPLEYGSKRVTHREVEDAFCRFRGEIFQRAPMYSAVKVGGQKLYRIAYSGKEVETPLRRAVVYETQVLRKMEENRFLFRVRCGKGTYIRTLCQDVGQAVGCPAHLSLLLRTRVGIFGLETGCTLDELRRWKEENRLSEAIRPADAAVSHLPRLVLPGTCWGQVKNGAGVPASRLCGGDAAEEGALVRIYLEEHFAGLGYLTQGQVKIHKLIWEESHGSIQ